MSDETSRDDQRTTDELLTELQQLLDSLSQRFEDRISQQGPRIINNRSLGDKDIIQFLNMLHKTLTSSGYWHPLVARKLGILGDMARFVNEDWFSGRTPSSPRYP
jgi:hypothetical protein